MGIVALFRPHGRADVSRRPRSGAAPPYACAARAAVDQGRAVPAFVGDAVPGRFPVQGDQGFADAARRAVAGMERALDLEEAVRAPDAPDIRFSVIRAAGPIRFRQAGDPERLAFTATGDAVGAVTRIDRLTGTSGRSVPVTDAVAAADPVRWLGFGAHPLPELGRAVRPRTRGCARDAFGHGDLTARINHSLVGCGAGSLDATPRPALRAASRPDRPRRIAPAGSYAPCRRPA